jgi:hypothetical protein
MKLGTYIIAPDPVLVAYLINSSHQSVFCMCMQGSVKCTFLSLLGSYLTHVPAATNTCNDRRIVGRVIFSAVRVL